MRRRRDTKRPRRGVAILAFVMALLVIGTFALWMLQLTATATTSTLGHFFSTGAFYAAESGIEMAVRELNAAPPSDFDSDGTIGTISDNGNPADDPTLVSGVVSVGQVTTSPPVYRATGRTLQTTSPWSSFTRTIEVRIE